MYSASNTPCDELPTSNAAAPSPPADSSVDPGRPERRSLDTTSAGASIDSAACSAPTADFTEPLASNAATWLPRRSAAWIVVALVLSRYGTATVLNHSDSGATVLRSTAERAASTPIVVASSSNDATERVPLPPPVPATAAMVERSSRRYGRCVPHERIPFIGNQRLLVVSRRPRLRRQPTSRAPTNQMPTTGQSLTGARAR